jgi:hypothetical protein
VDKSTLERFPEEGEDGNEGKKYPKFFTELERHLDIWKKIGTL